MSRTRLAPFSRVLIEKWGIFNRPSPRSSQQPAIGEDHPEGTIIRRSMSRRHHRPRSRHQFPSLILVLALLLCPRISPAQELARRLILKDGSYQLVTKYEVKGDRVRYMSAERDDWEELPTSLVDWPATEKYEKERAAGASVPEAVQLDKEIEQERDREEAQLPQVAPGLRLPEDSGVFLLDSFQGEPQIVEIQQTAGISPAALKATSFATPSTPSPASRRPSNSTAPTPRCRLTSRFLRSTSTSTPRPTIPPHRKIPATLRKIRSRPNNRNSRSLRLALPIVFASFAPK